MNKQKEANYLGVVFIGVIVAELLASTVLNLLAKAGIVLPSLLHTIIAEAAILIPVIVYKCIRKETFFEGLGYRKIRFTTVLLTIVLAIVTAPVGYFMNVVSQFVVPNVIVQSVDGLASAPVLATLFTTAVVAPFVEETVLRGFFNNKFKTLTSVVTAAVISGVLFGLVHLNLNQFCYAFAIGVIFALANFASGSIWTSIIMHAWFNFWNIAFLLLINYSLQYYNMNLSDMAENGRANTSQQIITAIVLFVISVICVFIIKLLLRAIAGNEGNQLAFDKIFNKKKYAQAKAAGLVTEEVSESVENAEKVRCFFNIPMIIGVIISVGTIILFDFIWA